MAALLCYSFAWKMLVIKIAVMAAPTPTVYKLETERTIEKVRITLSVPYTIDSNYSSVFRSIGVGRNST